MSYAILALPEQDFMPLEVLRKIEELVAAGATVVGPRPGRGTGLKDMRERDDAVKQLADRLWAGEAARTEEGCRHGKGRVFESARWRDVLNRMGIGPDFLVIDESQRDDLDCIHRRTETEDIYFVCNKTLSAKKLECVFRVQAGDVRFWDPVSGIVKPAKSFEAVAGGVQVKLALPPAGSVFVVFRKGSDAATTAADAAAASAADPSPVMAIDGPWTLRFPQGWGAPDSIAMDRLKSWTDSEVPGVRHFSGTAAYETTIAIPETLWPNAGNLWLDLGEVKEVAEVYLNGQSLGVVWTPPYRVNMGAALRPGENRLKVEVANLWANRMIGDKADPSGGVYTRSNMHDYFKAGTPLLPSGLLGPVRIVGE